ncbi:hypothetical protein S40288_04242 [Stachybotrys chartarum IBT 40288]|nr:hypothetical protein S40288_04242 [Stachybotrys chartarum IBT 40288]
MAQSHARDSSAQKFHPFFVKGRPDPSAPVRPADSDTRRPSDNDEASGSSEASDDSGQRKRRKTDMDPTRDQPEAKKQRRKRRNGRASMGGLITTNVKTTTQPPTSTCDDLTVTSIDGSAAHSVKDVPVQQAGQTERRVALPTTPNQTKKVRKFDPRTGTFGSPPKPKTTSQPSRLVVLKFGRDDEHRKDIGLKIAQILDGTLRLFGSPTGPSSEANPPKQIVQDKMTSKATHPFFAGKSKTAPNLDDCEITQAPKTKQKNSIFMSTPVSPQKARQAQQWAKAPQFGIKSFGMRISGAMHPLWPAHGMSHVKDVHSCQLLAVSSTTNSQPLKKSKGQAVVVPQQESILNQYLTRLELDGCRKTLPRDENSFEPAPPELRLPQRHFESGRNLQRRIRPQLRTLQGRRSHNNDTSGHDELSETSSKKIHDAISTLYDDLETRLSAYDRSSCENQAWTQKYAPTTASQVLQAGKEGGMLKQWLQALKVDSVHAGTSATSGKGKGAADVPVKKRGRKKKKLEDFIVESDEEEAEMEVVSDEEDQWAPAGPGTSSKSVVRNGDLTPHPSKEPRRPTNMILISGPHGSGKTAAVYAVAQELGIEIFEINSSSRRSGKDILEKVGDMTRNHLVQQHQAGKPHKANDSDDHNIKDFKSEKQGTMASFFKPKESADKKKLPGRQPQEVGVGETKSASSKSQKQSLILLEEVDILYEEDKQFWATLMSMVVQSKRPFIMTCNDETLVPIQSLVLHGIFRFASPPTELAVDLCLLIAANEGHALRRPAVTALYESRGHDLRATITELNYWCQIGVGDRRGGFDWFYLRWPKGSDLDDNGDVVRVVSENTYLKGMGWFGRDPVISANEEEGMQEEAMQQLWNTWTLDVGEWQETLGLQDWAQDLPKPLSPPNSKAAVAAYDNFSQAMSDADLCSAGIFEAGLRTNIDPSLPSMPEKTKNDFILGRTLLEAEPLTQYASPQKVIASSIKSLAKSGLRSACASLSSSSGSVLRTVDETMAIDLLESSLQKTWQHLTRYDIALAFDPIAVSARAVPASYLDPSVFDQTMRLIVTDVAPWVRGIVAYDHHLMSERLKLSNLLSEGGKRKRMRTTRSAYSALEGGQRSMTRRERYFGDSLNTGFVMRTGGNYWQDAIPRSIDQDAEGSAASSPKSVASEV